MARPKPRPTQVATSDVPEALRFSPPRREQLMRIAAALVNNHWAALQHSVVQLSRVMQLLLAGLSQPSDLPAFRQCLPAVVMIHERWARRGTVSSAKAALHALGGTAGLGSGATPPSAARPSDVHLHEARQLRCWLLHARLDPSVATAHDETTDALYTCLSSEARMDDKGGEGGAPGGSSSGVAARLWPLVESCLATETWLADEYAQTLLADLANNHEVGTQPSFRQTVARLAREVQHLRAEAAHAERS